MWSRVPSQAIQTRFRRAIGYVAPFEISKEDRIRKRTERTLSSFDNWISIVMAP
jgi:hypothetical protein